MYRVKGRGFYEQVLNVNIDLCNLMSTMKTM